MSHPAYLTFLAAGLALSAGLFLFSARRSGLSAGLAAAGFVLGLALAFLFAKGLYVLLYAPSLKPYGAQKWIRLQPEEFSFAAGSIGFCLGTACLFRGRGLPDALAALAGPACLLAACLRFGELFLPGTGLADPVSLGLPEIAEGSPAARFPFSVPDAWGYRYLSVSAAAALAALCCAGYAFAARRGKSGRGGTAFETCAYLLCCVRFFLETTRTDGLVFYYVHVDQALCAAVMAALMARACLRRRRASGRCPRACPALLAGCLVLNGLTQYLMDKPWQLESLLPEDAFLWINDSLPGLGYGVMLATAAAAAAAYLPLRRPVPPRPDAGSARQA